VHVFNDNTTIQRPVSSYRCTIQQSRAYWRLQVKVTLDDTIPSHSIRTSRQRLADCLRHDELNPLKGRQSTDIGRIGQHLPHSMTGQFNKERFIYEAVFGNGAPI
tara:strand:+ start:106004 stop:106318 length:315 start_codon:yes stop_codon:yes gene_type:complete